MSHIIAIAGKGGTGKTTLAALIVRALKEQAAGNVLAIDADPNSNLGEALGVKNPETIVDIVDDISRNPGQIPQGVTKDRFIDMRVQESLSEEEGFDLLSMGRPEGPGCYCFANNMLRELITKLMKNYPYIVTDNEAGMEHLSRRLLRKMDSLFIISDGTVIGVRSASRIADLAGELGITVHDRSLVLNKCDEKKLDILKPEIEKTGLTLKAALPFDKELEEASIRNNPVFQINSSNAVLNAVRGLLQVPAAKRG